ncbi:MAG: hypothetical protein GY754_10575 [bacterium]|nr:hypothetical protein [bacterium]
MDVYICGICGHLEFNEVSGECPVCHAPDEEFSRNDEIFEESEEKSPEAAVKHIPSVKMNHECALIPEEACTDLLIRIGETLHPMEEGHFIQFIDVYIDDIYIERIMFTPNSVNPAACIHLKKDTGKISIVSNCNLHDYWKTELNL